MNIKNKKIINILVAGLFLLLVFLLLAPLPKFNDPTSTVVFSSDKHLLGARIAEDGQWRFPAVQEVPGNYEKALLNYEDRWFYYHPGINPVAIVRALRLNIKHREVVSGGSTISMQVARMARKNPPRTLTGKLLEMAMALKLEILHSKKEILRLYASAAPFGGNVVGIDAASWRYFNRAANELSWAEAATLAVLPNAPSLMHPGRNREALENKRNRLLQILLEREEIDTLEYHLAIAETLPEKPHPLPDVSSHAVEKLVKSNRGENVTTTIRHNLQLKVNDVVGRHHGKLAQNQIHNLAALVVEVKTGNILAYVGNAPGAGREHDEMVDIITAPRSTGSILKPFLYAAMLQQGEILPNTLVKDVPINFSGYSPVNFDNSYSGAVPAANALSRSLNVPAVEMLHKHGEAKFLNELQSMGFTTFERPAEHYGLSLILGGGEATLLELAGAYASLARVLNHFNTKGGYNNSDYRQPVLVLQNTSERTFNDEPRVTASSIWFMLQALQKVNRPEGRSGWEYFSSSGRVAWKTGTSYGFRDAWAIATTPEYVVAVWAGNADGEGRAGLTGSKAAAPVLFDLLDLIPQSTWFEKPEYELTTVEVCAESGYKVSPYCTNKQTVEVPVSGLRAGACPYHRLVHLSSDRQWQVNSSCYPVSDMVHDSCFILPPGMEWYYRKVHPEYRTLPPVLKGCIQDENYQIIELLYPRNLSKLYVPLEMDGERGRIVFEAAHRNPAIRLFWHLDDEFVGETRQFHQMGLMPGAGAHILTLVDEDGNRLVRKFVVASSFKTQ